MGDTSKVMSKKEIEQSKFRVCCLQPYMDGAIPLGPPERLCGHGHGMTVVEMNENLIWKGKPYIRIGYCKYCYHEDTIGVLDDTPQLLGWAILSPDDENPNFRFEKLSPEGHTQRVKQLTQK
ncbi:MAG: hypothetical protein KKA79_01875 [Nanoarchaeota archaeon]|nr:hypothetical protein [Nanoarchaeota archaeon]MCG2717670.1 hypothetical protein [Nanoarchaeota archaeon]